MKVSASTEEAKRQKANAAGDKLCEAVAVWWKEMGGVPIVIGGIALRGGERKAVYEVAVRVTGIRPDMTYELQPTKKRLKLRREVARKKR